MMLGPASLSGSNYAVARWKILLFQVAQINDPAYRELRALHAADLDPMRHSLSGFLTAWVGGPRDWFLENPGNCMMSLHAPIAVTRQTAEQWVDAMSHALRSCAVSPDLAAKIETAFAAMAANMVRSG
jgi:hemoglobin